MTAPAPSDWRPMALGDVPGAIRLAAKVHPRFFERAEVFHDRLAIYPAGMLVLPGAAGTLAGYAMAYPIRIWEPPPLDTVLGALASDADSLYIHDVALDPGVRGSGLAVPAIHRLLRLAGERPATLISVYRTWGFWQRFGFQVVRGAGLDAKVRSYGSEAVFMLREAGLAGPGDEIVQRH